MYILLPMVLQSHQVMDGLDLLSACFHTLMGVMYAGGTI